MLDWLEKQSEKDSARSRSLRTKDIIRNLCTGRLGLETQPFWQCSKTTPLERKSTLQDEVWNPEEERRRAKSIKLKVPDEVEPSKSDLEEWSPAAGAFCISLLLRPIKRERLFCTELIISRLQTSCLLFQFLLVPWFALQQRSRDSIHFPAGSGCPAPSQPLWVVRSAHSLGSALHQRYIFHLLHHFHHPSFSLAGLAVVS